MTLAGLSPDIGQTVERGLSASAIAEALSAHCEMASVSRLVSLWLLTQLLARASAPMASGAAEDDTKITSSRALRDMFLSFGEASHGFDRSSNLPGGALEKAVGTSKALLWEKGRQMIAECQNRPLLYSYSSDATPMITKRKIHRQLGTGETATRSSGAGTDFLLQSAWVKGFNASGGFVQSALFKEPVPLEEGTTALHEFTAMVKFMPTMRMQGASNIVLNHTAFDRA